MSPLRSDDRLSALASEIKALRVALLEHERDAFDLADEAAIERAALTRGRLDAALASYFEISEASRTAAGCAVHGMRKLAACPDCATGAA